MCLKFNFGCAAYTRDIEPSSSRHQVWPINERSAYDIYSIMHYPTDFQGVKACDDWGSE